MSSVANVLLYSPILIRAEKKLPKKIRRGRWRRIYTHSAKRMIANTLENTFLCDLTINHQSKPLFWNWATFPPKFLKMSWQRAMDKCACTLVQCICDFAHCCKVFLFNSNSVASWLHDQILPISETIEGRLWFVCRTTYTTIKFHHIQRCPFVRSAVVEWIKVKIFLGWLSWSVLLLGKMRIALCIVFGMYVCY